MAYSHWTGMGPRQVQGMGPAAMGIKIYRNVHTGPKQEKEPGPIAFHCAGPVPGIYICEQMI